MNFFNKYYFTKFVNIRFRVYLLALITLCLPIDTMLTVGEKNSISIYIMFFYIIVRFMSTIVKCPLYIKNLNQNFFVIIYALYFLLSIFWSENFDVMGWFFRTFLGYFLFYLFAIMDKYTNEEIYIINCAIYYSVILFLIGFVLFVDVSNLKGRLILQLFHTIDPNYLCMGFCLPISYLLKDIVNKKRVIINIFFMICLFFIIILTGSRGGVLANATVLFFGLLLFNDAKNITRMFFLLLGLLGFMIIFQYYANYIPQEVIQRFSIEHLAAHGGSGRDYIWRYALNKYETSSMFQHIFGYGIAEFRFGNMLRVAHNIFIQSLYEGGILGVILLIVAILNLLYCSFKINKVAFCALLGLIVGSMSIDIISSRAMWFTFFYCTLDFYSINTYYYKGFSVTQKLSH